MSVQNSGGFLPQVLPSPSPSTASTVTPGAMPKPREHPLRPGSQKEIAFINFVDSKMLNINRRYAKKFSSDPDARQDSGRGYASFKEVVEDLEALFDVIWVSGTPLLQVPYLLSLASTLVSYLPAFPFSAKPTVRMVRKLDMAFTHLLQLDDSNNLASLSNESSDPHARDRKIVSRTDRVRIKSVCEMTRVCAVEQRQSVREDQEDLSESETEEDEESFNEPGGTRTYDITMGIAGLYESTLGMIGDSLISLDQPNNDQPDLDLDLPMDSSEEDLKD